MKCGAQVVVWARLTAIRAAKRRQAGSLSISPTNAQTGASMWKERVFASRSRDWMDQMSPEPRKRPICASGVRESFMASRAAARSWSMIGW